MILPEIFYTFLDDFSKEESNSEDSDDEQENLEDLMEGDSDSDDYGPVEVLHEISDGLF